VTQHNLTQQKLNDAVHGSFMIGIAIGAFLVIAPATLFGIAFWIFR